jgi:hypothetical protein
VDFSLQDSGFLIATFCSFILQQTVEWSIDKSFYWIDGQKNTKKPTFALKKEYVKNTVVYVHVRAYKTVGGKKICGGWSKRIKVKVK